ncbi:chromosomal replication initiator protein DnaA [Helicobacter heilmannii]|uniref:Chromosomal replication initiator protein DnaA n=2 Tax=Helicobacter heilmannii TaxID=35817 RepID=A0A0K2Y7C4_HELHE|nr:chromosomal replication initiator protein DnaA [Helicobacter heilmannii]BDQ26325.1 chromosomal replication initiator protein DnaA [Helicobacter heilmannii]CCM11317.1 Chromosomal replication initiator protein DnaA [Helicobacter heilmannii ASB1.4]CRI34738.1 Chromosomal replication initiator protein DnaA [Helicobacter heilmannii]
MLEDLLTLKAHMSAYEFQTYIQPLCFDPHASSAACVVFYAPNVWLSHYIQTRYGALLEQLLSAKHQSPLKVQICPKEAKPKAPPKPLIKAKSNPTLNPAFTFDTLVVGACNHMAVKVASQVAQKSGVYNPVLFFGGVGLGKTHILNAIGNTACDRLQSVLYVTAEQFLNDYVFRLSNHSMDKFQEKYRSCDYLLIDDVQFFGGKEMVQEEFYHTFNTLHAQGKQIVMSSDKPPKHIKGLADRLLSRFEMGMIASIQAPMLETKIAILTQKCQLNHICMDQEIVEYLASHIHENIRQLEGALLRLNATAALSGEEISLRMAQEILKDTTKERLQEVGLEDILRVVAQTLNVKPADIRNNSRNRQVALARKLIIYLARTLTDTSTNALAQFLGLKDHSGVSKASKTIAQSMAKENHTKLLVEEMQAKINSPKPV